MTAQPQEAAKKAALSKFKNKSEKEEKKKKNRTTTLLDGIFKKFGFANATGRFKLPKGIVG